MTPAVVGIDPSLASTGVAVVHPGGHIAVSRVRSKGARSASWAQRHARITDMTERVLHRALRARVESGPSGVVAVIEAPAYAAASTSQHDRAGLWWALYGALESSGAVVVPVAPASRCKYATGRGNAGKDEVLAAVVRRYPDVDVTGNDVADAVVFAAMGRRLVGAPLEAALPKAHLSAMGKVVWPAAAGA